MLTLNGKEYGLFWSIGARCKFDTWIVKNPDAPMSDGIVHRALMMNEAYVKANGGGEKLTLDMIYSLPSKDFDALVKAQEEQFNIDSAISVEAEEEKPKKAKNATLKSN